MLIKQVCGIPISDNVVELIFYIFDTNGDGNLSSDEFLMVLQSKEMNIQLREEGFKGLISCWSECIQSSPSSKLVR